MADMAAMAAMADKAASNFTLQVEFPMTSHKRGKPKIIKVVKKRLSKILLGCCQKRLKSASNSDSEMHKRSKTDSNVTQK